MDDFTTAVSVIVGSFALLFGWRKFRRGPPPPAPTANPPPAVTTRPTAVTDREAKRHVQEACWIHQRWSVAENTHVACFDLFTILATDEASFCGEADSFAAVVGPSMQDHSMTGEEKTRVMMSAWKYLSDPERYHTYTTVLAPLVAKQKHDLKLDCVARPVGRAPPPGLGAMSNICGW
ncbi:hypothetical protein KVR01_007269 [Diaporthe batatas]|uniref:uncharacterized protein n=1 Tax=Diaporthe batatas TaxID=748121 RepID=UPI001D04ECFE|nr:uncharacterized protein KVR01_007269 [Diaporthe batatas]KAG8162791.1 hypothetical protein KVR01_007269 [Diaporthe batatas]